MQVTESRHASIGEMVTLATVPEEVPWTIRLKRKATGIEVEVPYVHDLESGKRLVALLSSALRAWALGE